MHPDVVAAEVRPAHAAPRLVEHLVVSVVSPDGGARHLRGVRELSTSSLYLITGVITKGNSHLPEVRELDDLVLAYGSGALSLQKQRHRFS
jgi:hypothetical protein